MKRAALLLALAVLPFVAFDQALAGTCDVTEYPASGILTAERMNQRIRQTEACVNGRIGNGNWATGEPLAVGNLQNQYAINAVSWTIGDEDGNATAGEIIAAANEIRIWRYYTNATIVGMSVLVRCPSAGTCAGASATVTLQKAAVTIKSFTGLSADQPYVDFAISNAITSSDSLNIDVGGTLTDVKFIDIVIYFKVQHQA